MIRRVCFAGLLLSLLTPFASVAEPPRIVRADASGSAISLRFDQPMLTWLGESRTAQIRIRPAVDCGWYWEDSEHLVCRLEHVAREARLPAATRFRIGIPEGLWSQSGEALAPTTLELDSQPPTLVADVLDWHAGQPELMVLGGTAAVEAAAISRVLVLEFDGAPLAYTLRPLSPAQRAKRWFSADANALQVVPSAWPEPSGMLKMALRAGLRSTEGPLPGEAKEELLSVRVNRPLELAALGCNWNRGTPIRRNEPPPIQHCDADATVVLHFTRRLAEGEAERIATGLTGLTVSDAGRHCRGNCVVAHGGPFRVQFSAKAAGSSLRIELPDDLRAEDGSQLEPRGVPTIVFGDRPIAVSADPPLRVLRPGDAAALELGLRNLPGPLELGELSIGRRSLVRKHLLPAVAATNELEPWRAPLPAGDVSRRGGLVLAGLVGSYRPGFAVAVAPFNVVASRDSERVLVWASDWDSAAGIAGAEVVLLEVGAQGSEKILGKARTGADGVAFLPAPPESVGGRGMPRLVRVSRGGRQAVVPVESWAALDVADIPDPADADDEDFHQAYDSGIQVFGVSDRLLYRPGETVQFRLWPRERKHNRLLALMPTGETTLSLSAPGADSELDEWPANYDAWGSLSGERRLPDDLADDFYCISTSSESPDWGQQSGACFQVARFEPQALWASGQFDRTLVRPGDPLTLDIEGGFYSGGGAAEARLGVMAWLQPIAFGEAYPEFARFQFLDARDEDGEAPELDPLANLAIPERLDGRGRARATGRIPQAFVDDDGETPVAFGRILANASVSVPGGNDSAAPSITVVYAAHPRYVGLRTDGWWLRTDQDPVLEAVVATDDGKPVTGARVQVRIERDGDEGAEVLARCELETATPTPCAFRAPSSGRYRLVAESKGAAAVRFDRYFYGRGGPELEDEAEASLEVVSQPVGGSDAVLRLRQPHARARALFVVEYERMLRHWVQDVGPDTEVTVPVLPDWAPGVSVRVLLRPVLEGPGGDAPELRTLDAIARLDIPNAVEPTLGIAFDRERSAPGEERVIRLHNPGTRARLVTLAITDDSVHQQVEMLHRLMDPAGARFLGVLDQWSGADWFGYGPWAYLPNVFDAVAIEIEAAQAAAVVMGRSSTLDSVEVTGSRISRADLMHTQGPAPVAPGEERPADGPPIARVRSRFPVTAYWNPGEEIAPGETREIRVTLPDNLTRWRLLAWSSDRDDGFALAEATLEASLPLELRAGLPTRLFEGDEGSGTVLARVNAEEAASVQLTVDTEGAGADGRVTASGEVRPQASLARRVPLAPDEEGRIALLANARTSTASDALSSAVEVRSRLATAAIAQVGWLEGGPLALRRPDLPRGAFSPVLDLSVSQGTIPWRDDWLRDLREYPHRCWEQTLSRALGASIALQSPDAAARWPDAGEVVADALRNAPSFRDDNGYFHYFTNHDYGADLDPVLAAYTLRALQVMARLGQPVPDRLRAELREQLERHVAVAARSKPGIPDRRVEGYAVALGALATEAEPPALDLVPRLWRHWEDLSWHGRSELARAAAADPRHADIAAASLAALREGGQRIGARRVLSEGRDTSWLMGSRLRDQCAITATLWTLDRSPEHQLAREQWLRGLSDLYAGGTGSLDSQASAQCLLALLAVDEVRAADAPGATDAEVAAVAGLQSATLRLDAATPVASWEAPLAPDAGLELTPKDSGDGTLNYRAEVRYLLDQREATPEATGMRLQRSYQVLRDGAWRELGEGSVVEGDWLRVTLRLDVPAMRHFVAITDTVPGGLVTRDVRLAGVGGENLQRLADPGSWWFDTRQTGATEVRLYAQRLPRGSHELHYYTQATHAGRYFAPPAVAELMYGRASRSNTGPRTLVVRPAP